MRLTARTRNLPVAVTSSALLGRAARSFRALAVETCMGYTAIIVDTPASSSCGVGGGKAARATAGATPPTATPGDPAGTQAQEVTSIRLGRRRSSSIFRS